MNVTFFKKYFGWKTLVLLAIVTLAACGSASEYHIDRYLSENNPLLYGFLTLGLVILTLFAILLFPMPHMVEAVPTDIPHVRPTNTAVFSVNWAKKTETIQQNGETIDVPGGNYQLSLPFSDYTRTGQTIKPDNHFNLSQAFHFGMPLISETDEQGDLPANMDEAKQSSIPFSLSFTPIASNQQQLAESTNWLSTKENLPISEQVNSKTDNMIRLYKPITLKRDNQILATVDSLVIEKNQHETEKGVHISLEGIYGPIKTQEKNGHYGPGHFSFVLNHLDATLVHQLEKEIFDIKQSSNNQQVLTQLKILAQLKALCKKGSTMTITYDVHSPQGPSHQQYTIDLADLVNAPTQFASPMPIDLGLLFGEN